MRVLFALPGLHRVNRGAEVAFESVADEIAAIPGMQVTLVGSGEEHPGRRYRFEHAGCLARERFERWPKVPLLRDECAYEELTFAPGLMRACARADYDITATCSYPFTNWTLRAARSKHRRAPHVFVTQNGDWPALRSGLEFRAFGCDGLVALNPEVYERQHLRWRTALIPNGVDPDLFVPGRGDRLALGLPESANVILMVSALVESKHVLDGIRCAARVEGSFLVVAGDGPLRDEVDREASRLMPGRFRRMTLPKSRMPEIYRASDLLLHMSRAESFGNIYVEALAMGLPVVAHDNPSTRWILEDQGVLVDCANEDAVVEGIDRALQLRSAESARERRGLVERRFTWHSIAGQYCRFLEEVLGHAGDGAQP